MSERVAKVLGEDMELGNFHQEEGALHVVAGGLFGATGEQAARRLLAEIDGIPSRRSSLGASGRLGDGSSPPGRDGDSQGAAEEGDTGPSESQDWGRKFLPGNGGCAYIDLAHLELCIPEVRSAHEAVAAHHAMLRIGSDALAAANAHCERGRYELLAANSDRLGNSYGSHLNVLVTRECWDDLFRSKLHPLLVLAAYQVSSIVLTGQGKVGSENRRPEVSYQIGQRADFFETLVGPQTTYQRPIVNSRDEPLCGGRGNSELARLHCIFYDNTLCQVATLLKFGGLQIVLAMIEAGHADLDLALDDPLRAVLRWSHDTSLEARCKLANGESVTAIALQQRFIAAARRCADAGGLDTVPRADEILALWEETLDALALRDFELLAGRLDWVLKRQLLERAMARRPDLGWDSPETFYLDLLYSSLDRETGLYWAYEAAGRTEPVVSQAEIARFVSAPPDDTRAWSRAALLRDLERDQIESVDWDEIEVRLPRAASDGGPSWRRGRRVALQMDDPRRSTRAQMEPLLERAGSAIELIECVAPEPEREPGARTRLRLLPN